MTTTATATMSSTVLRRSFGSALMQLRPELLAGEHLPRQRLEPPGRHVLRDVPGEPQTRETMRDRPRVQRGDVEWLRSLAALTPPFLVAASLQRCDRILQHPTCLVA